MVPGHLVFRAALLMGSDHGRPPPQKYDHKLSYHDEDDDKSS